MATAKVLETITLAEGFIPVDLSAAANDGAWASMKHYEKALVLFFAAVGTAGQDPTITLEQAKDVAGTAGKSLNTTGAWHKTAATNLRAVGAFTKVTQSSANTFTVAGSANQAKLWAIEIDYGGDTTAPCYLDLAGGFTAFRGRVADVGANAQLGCMLYAFFKPLAQTVAEKLVSVIAD